jgi:hypothetical protein
VIEARDAFRWPGGAELLIEVALDKGRPAEFGEVIEAFQQLRWTATVAEALANYGAWLARSKSPEAKFSEFHKWVMNLPDASLLPASVDALFMGQAELERILDPSPADPTYSRVMQYFDAPEITRKLVALVGTPTQLDRSLIGPMDLSLSLQLLAVVYENPTRSWISVKGSLIALGVGASLWGAVALSKELNAHDCREQARATFQYQSEMIMKQARLQGKMTPELLKALDQVTKATFAATAACEPQLPDMKLTLYKSGKVEVSLSHPPRQTSDQETQKHEAAEVDAVHVRASDPGKKQSAT